MPEMLRSEELDQFAADTLARRLGHRYIVVRPAMQPVHLKGRVAAGYMRDDDT
jgi:hypothetical protein